MAKKQTPAPTPEAKDKGFYAEYQHGTRKCPKCNHYTKGPKAPKCLNPDCGYDFPPTTPKDKGSGASVQPAIGGLNLANALKQADKVKQFVVTHGGYEKAKELLFDIQTIADDCGCLSQLSQAIATLEVWDKK